MVNPRQRHKARTSHKTVQHSRHAKRNLKKMKPIRGPKPIQDAWDKKKTLRQNYAAMGLAGSLKIVDSGGSEHPPPSDPTPTISGESTMLDRSGKSTEGAIRPGYGKILRDAAGNVVGVEMPEEETEGENELMEVTDDIEDNRSKTELVEALESLANASKAVPRFSSGGELVTLRKLVTKHGQDLEAMSKDRRLNEWQRTPGQLRRACAKAGLI